VVSGKLRNGSLILGQVGNQATVIAVISDPTRSASLSPGPASSWITISLINCSAGSAQREMRPPPS